MIPPTSKFQILALSGGGIKGLYTARMLAHWEDEILNGEPIGSRFDLITGTSIGGIIACAIAAKIPMRKVVEMFEVRGPEIFKKRKFSTLSSLFRPSYQQEHLKSSLTSLLPENMLYRELQRPLLIPAFNMTTGKLKVFKTPYKASWINDAGLRVVDVALATSAAPTFFQLAQLDDGGYADGGICANAPDLIALHEAEHFLGRTLESISLLSLGTTTGSVALSPHANLAMGSISWMFPDKKLIKAFMASQEQLALGIVKQKLGDSYLRIDWERSAEQENALGLDKVSGQTIANLKQLGLSDAKSKVHLVTPFFNHEVTLNNG